MRRQAIVALLAVSFCGLPLFIGCDKTAEETKTTDKAPDGSQTSTEHKVTQNASGTVTKTVDETKTKAATNP